MNKKPFEVEQIDLNEGTEKFKEGQLIIYKGVNGYEIGKIKKLKDDKSAFIWYYSGDTAALTDFDSIEPIINDYCIQDLLNKEVEE